MSMVRLTVFVIALLLAAGALEPTGAWLVTMAVLSGIAVFVGGRRGGRFRLRRLRAWVGKPWSDEYDW